MNNINNIVPKKLPINKNPNVSIFNRVGSGGSSGNLPTPINALSTSLTTEEHLIRKHHCSHKGKT